MHKWPKKVKLLILKRLKRLATHWVILHGVELVLYDTPGELEIREKVVAHYQNVDLVLYCIRMDDARFRSDDMP